MNKKRRPVDAWFWELFVQACGTKCCSCGAAEVKLERGHVIPHGVGGTDGLDNLLPVCLPCNKKYLKKETPDNRPPDWLERFFLLLGHILKPQISADTRKGLSYLIPTTHQAENKQLISWESDILGLISEVFTQSSDLTKREAEALVRKLVKRSENLRPKPRLPFATRQTEMIGHALKHGRETFWHAGLEFLTERPWLPTVEGHDIERDSWRCFAEHFWIYELKWHERQEGERLSQRSRPTRIRHCERFQMRSLHVPMRPLAESSRLSESN